MDRLPSILDQDQLTYLKVDESFPIDFNFIQQFKLLFEFESNQASFDLAVKAFRQPYLRRFQFKDGDEYVEIHKSPSLKDAFDLKIYKLANNDQQIRERIYSELDLKWARLMGIWEQRILLKLSSLEAITAPVATAVGDGKRASATSGIGKRLKASP